MLQTETPKAGETLAVLKTNMGDIKIRLFPEHAPKAVENFKTHDDKVIKARAYLEAGNRKGYDAAKRAAAGPHRW